MHRLCYFFLLIIFIITSVEQSHSQSFTLQGPKYVSPDESEGVDTLRPVMFNPQSVNYFLQFAGDTLPVSFVLETSGNFRLRQSSRGYLPVNQVINHVARKSNGDTRYIFITWYSRDLPESSRLRVWTATDSAIINIAGIPVTPEGLVYLHPDGGSSDTTAQGVSLCRDRRILNFSGLPVTITNYRFGGSFRTDHWQSGVHYSVDNMPALPFTIKDRDSLDLSICYTPPFPDEYDHDTLVLSTLRDGALSEFYVFLFGHSLPSSVVERISSKRVTAYPNPVWTQLMVTGLSEGHHQARILDALGREVLTAVCEGTVCTINVSTMPSGYYVLLVGDRLPYHFIK